MPSIDQSDKELMLALVEGKESALDILITRWERPLFSFVYRYFQNEATTRDLIQETFVRVFTKREHYNSDYAFSSWIFTIAANLCRNETRWRKRHPSVSLNAMQENSDDNGTYTIETEDPNSPVPSDTLERSEANDIVKEAVLSLPHDLKTALLLHHFEELSYKEISEIVGCSIRGVETRLYRARKLLRKRLESNESIQKKKSHLDRSGNDTVDFPNAIGAASVGSQ